MKTTNWTEKEDNILFTSVKTNQCISNAFKEASGITGRSVSACSARYYNVLRKDEHFCALYVRKKSMWERFCNNIVDWILK